MRFVSFLEKSIYEIVLIQERQLSARGKDLLKDDSWEIYSEIGILFGKINKWVHFSSNTPWLVVSSIINFDKVVLEVVALFFLAW